MATSNGTPLVLGSRTNFAIFGILLAFDGAEWRGTSVGTGMFAVASSWPEHTWLVGDGGAARHLDAAGVLTDHPIPSGEDFLHVSAGADGTATAVDNDGVMWRFDGTAWATFGQAPPAAFSSVQDLAFNPSPTSASTEMWVTSSFDELWFFDGTWTDLGLDADAVKSVAEDELWRLAGSTLTHETAAGTESFTLTTIDHWWVTQNDEVWTENNGTVSRLVDGALVPFDIPAMREPVLVDGGDDVWAIDEVLTGLPVNWRFTNGVPQAHEELISVGVIARAQSGELIAIDSATGVWRREGGRWVRERQPWISPTFWGRVSGARIDSPSDMWLIDATQLVHLDGQGGVFDMSAGATTMVTRADGASFALGSLGAVLRYVP